jgi:zinc transporter ZupT
LDFLLEYNPVVLALFATLFTWGVTALGASMVFFFKAINKRILNSMLGFAAGVMINPDAGMLAGAVALAIGIGLQNFPEGTAVSIPLRREGFSRLKDGT